MFAYDENRDRRQPPFWRLHPPVILGLVAVICAVTFYQWGAGPAQENRLFALFALAGGPEFDGATRPIGEAPSFVLHVLLHGGVLHLAFNMLALLGLGSPLLRVFGRGTGGTLAFLGFFAFCAVGGAAAQLLYWAAAGQSGIAIGASSAISGLLPALGYVMGGWKGAMRNSVVWVLINLAIAVVGVGFPIPLAWAAHLGGVAAGFSVPLFLRLARR